MVERRKISQSMLEFCLLIILTIAVIFTLQRIIISHFQGIYKQTTERLGAQRITKDIYTLGKWGKTGQGSSFSHSSNWKYSIRNEVFISFGIDRGKAGMFSLSRFSGITSPKDIFLSLEKEKKEELLENMEKNLYEAEALSEDKDDNDIFRKKVTLDHLDLETATAKNINDKLAQNYSGSFCSLRNFVNSNMDNKDDWSFRIGKKKREDYKVINTAQGIQFEEIGEDASELDESEPDNLDNYLTSISQKYVFGTDDFKETKEEYQKQTANLKEPAEKIIKQNLDFSKKENYPLDKEDLKEFEKEFGFEFEG